MPRTTKPSYYYDLLKDIELMIKKQAALTEERIIEQIRREGLRLKKKTKVGVSLKETAREEEYFGSPRSELLACSPLSSFVSAPIAVLPSLDVLQPLLPVQSVLDFSSPATPSRDVLNSLPEVIREEDLFNYFSVMDEAVRKCLTMKFEDDVNRNLLNDVKQKMKDQIDALGSIYRFEMNNSFVKVRNRFHVFFEKYADWLPVAGHEQLVEMHTIQCMLTSLINKFAAENPSEKRYYKTACECAVEIDSMLMQWRSEYKPLDSRKSRDIQFLPLANSARSEIELDDLVRRELQKAEKLLETARQILSPEASAMDMDRLDRFAAYMKNPELDLNENILLMSESNMLVFNIVQKHSPDANATKGAFREAYNLADQCEDILSQATGFVRHSAICRNGAAKMPGPNVQDVNTGKGNGAEFDQGNGPEWEEDSESGLEDDNDAHWEGYNEPESMDIESTENSVLPPASPSYYRFSTSVEEICREIAKGFDNLENRIEPIAASTMKTAKLLDRMMEKFDGTQKPKRVSAARQRPMKKKRSDEKEKEQEKRLKKAAEMLLERRKDEYEDGKTRGLRRSSRVAVKLGFLPPQQF